MSTHLYTYLAYGGWILIYVVWFTKSVGNKRTVKLENPVEQTIVSALMFTNFVLIYGWPFFSGWLAVRLVPASTLFGILGVIITYASAIFAIWARMTIGKNWSGLVVTVKEKHELIQAGPYRLVRHPIYVGFLVATLGTALTIGLFGSLLSFTAMLIAFLIRIRREETIMLREFPGDYPTYKKRTKALVPFLL
jgi:protein-S-isoprenylcysteine O-methyltransferase Ste14